MKKTKTDPYKFFNSEIKRFVNYFGLHEWEIEISDDAGDNDRAMTSWYPLNHESYGSQIINISYNKEWLSDKTTAKEEITRVVFHEIMEVMLSRLRSLCLNTEIKISDREVDSEIHRVIRTFENKVLPLL